MEIGCLQAIYMTVLLMVSCCVCAGLVFYAYAGYPLLIWAVSRFFGRRSEPPALEHDDVPTISVVLAAHNEEMVIEQWILNSLKLDYPSEKLELVIGSDGSNDRTVEIVSRYVGKGVVLLAFDQNRGKASVLNEAVEIAKGEILLMSDANTLLERGAARSMARWFRDPHIGAVVGRLVLTDPATARNADGLYWKYETFLKKNESRLGALLGANGAIYSIRKALYEPIPTDTIVDDFVIPLRARLRTGCSIVYDWEAVAREETAPDVESEFHRRVRIGAGGFQAMARLSRLLDPRHGWVAFTFLSHKVLRWLCPFFLIAMLLSNLLLLNFAFFRYLLFAQLTFYLTAALGALINTRVRIPKLLCLLVLFVGMNTALLFGFARWLSGRQNGSWRRTARAPALSWSVGKGTASELACPSDSAPRGS